MRNACGRHSQRFGPMQGSRCMCSIQRGASSSATTEPPGATSAARADDGPKNANGEKVVTEFKKPDKAELKKKLTEAGATVELK